MNEDEFRAYLRQELSSIMKESAQLAPAKKDDSLDEIIERVPVATPEVNSLPSSASSPPNSPDDGDATGPSDSDDIPSENIRRNDSNEWNQYQQQQSTMSEFLESEWDHKSFLLSTKFQDRDSAMKLHELVLKELSLSNLPDFELAMIYSIKMDCIEEWLSMGFYDLAKQRLTHMLFRLNLNKSIEALELMGQHGEASINITRQQQELERMGWDQDQEKKPKLGLGGITDRLRGKKNG